MSEFKEKTKEYLRRLGESTPVEKRDEIMDLVKSTGGWSDFVEAIGEVIGDLIRDNQT